MPTLDGEDGITGQENARVVRVRCEQHGVRVGQRDGRVVRDSSLISPVLPGRIVGRLRHVGRELVLRLLPGLVPGLTLLVSRSLEPLPEVAQDLLVQRRIEGDFFDGAGQLTHGALLKLLSLLWRGSSSSSSDTSLYSPSIQSSIMTPMDQQTPMARQSITSSCILAAGLNSMY